MNFDKFLGHALIAVGIVCMICSKETFLWLSLGLFDILLGSAFLSKEEK